MFPITWEEKEGLISCWRAWEQELGWGMSLTTSAQGLLLTGGTALTIGILHPCHFMHNNSSQGRLDQRESVTFERQLIFICVVLTIEALNETSLVERQIWFKGEYIPNGTGWGKPALESDPQPRASGAFDQSCAMEQKKKVLWGPLDRFMRSLLPERAWYSKFHEIHHHNMRTCLLSE